MGSLNDTAAYSSGDWHVRAGSEDAFVARWREFVEWTLAVAPGFVEARLIRDTADPQHFVSLAEWHDLAAQDVWRGLPDFAPKLAACKVLCDEDRNSRYTLAVWVAPGSGERTHAL